MQKDAPVLVLFGSSICFVFLSSHWKTSLERWRKTAVFRGLRKRLHKEFGSVKRRIRGQLVWFICITSTTMTGLLPVCVQLIAFIEASGVRSEWGSVRPSESRRPPQAKPVHRGDWLRLQREGGIPFQQLGLPRDSSLSFFFFLFGPLAHTKDTAGASPCQCCLTRTQSSPQQRGCLLSFIKCPPPVSSLSLSLSVS